MIYDKEKKTIQNITMLDNAMGTKISCDDSTGDLCAIYVSSVGSGESAPATTANVYNHLYVVSMFQYSVRCNKIPQYTTFAR